MNPDEELDDVESVDTTFGEMIETEIAREERQSATRAALILLSIGAASAVVFGLAVIGAVTVVRWVF